MPRQHTTDDKAYAAARRELLADNPPCSWGCGRMATEADHIVPYVLGGSNDITNLTPSCRPCNASRGAVLGNQLRKGRHEAIAAAQEQPQTVVKKKRANVEGYVTKKEKPANPSHDTSFFTDENLPAPVASYRISQKPQSVAETGDDQPRLETITPDGVRSRAAEIVSFAKDVLGVELYPWQIRCLHGITALDDDDNFLRRVSLLSVARQNGKSLLGAAAIGWFLTIEAPRRGGNCIAISVAHKLDLAVAMFKYLAPILQKKFGAKVSWSYGRNELELHGHTWIVRAATPQAGHGYSASFLYIDEAWDISEDAIDTGLLPTQRAVTNPICLMVSTAGTQNSHALLRWRGQGLRQIDAGEVSPMYFAEWSPPATLDPMTPEAWKMSNPSIGRGGLTIDVLHAEAKAPNRSAFLRSSVNIWVASSTSWLEPGLFASCATTDPIPKGGTLSVETSLDGTRYVAVRAVQDGNRSLVTVAFDVDNLAAAWEKIAEQMRDPSLQLTITPPFEISCPREYDSRRAIVGYRELGRWTQGVRALIVEGRVAHSGEISLIEQTERAVLVRHQQTVALSSARSSGPIEMARAMVFAVAMVSRPANNAKPIVAFSNS